MGRREREERGSSSSGSEVRSYTDREGREERGVVRRGFTHSSAEEAARQRSWKEAESHLSFSSLREEAETRSSMESQTKRENHFPYAGRRTRTPREGKERGSMPGGRGERLCENVMMGWGRMQESDMVRGGRRKSEAEEEEEEEAEE